LAELAFVLDWLKREGNFSLRVPGKYGPH
jgi:hypothetical protein